MNRSPLLPPRDLAPVRAPAALTAPARLGARAWAGRLVVLLLLGTAAVTGIWWIGHPAPTSLSQVTLVGTRGPACLRLVIAQDVSGSMIDYVEARNSALAQLVAWAPANLRDDDELAVVNFAGTAGEVVGPYPVGDTGAATAPGAPAGGDNTNFTPLLDTVADLPPTSCDTALVLLSDGMLSDLPQNEGRGLDLLTAAGVHDLRLLVPSRSIDVPQEWSVAFPSAEPLKFEGNDPDATGLALARSIAALTQQEVRPA